MVLMQTALMEITACLQIHRIRNQIVGVAAGETVNLKHLQMAWRECLTLPFQMKRQQHRLPGQRVNRAVRHQTEQIKNRQKAGIPGLQVSKTPDYRTEKLKNLREHGKFRQRMSRVPGLGTRNLKNR